MRVLVTGCSGFIGTHLCRALLSRGHEVIGLSRTRPALGLAAHHSCAIDDPAARVAAQECAIIFHLAGLADASSSLGDPFSYGRVNALGTLNMLEAARASQAHFVLASSQRVYPAQQEILTEETAPHPGDPYGYSKLLAETWVEMYASLYDVPATVLRLFSVYGPGQFVAQGASGVVSILAQRALGGLPLEVDAGQRRDFTYIADVVRAMLLLLEAPRRGVVTYNVATGQATTLEELAAAVLAVTGKSLPIRVNRPGAPTSYVADISRARSGLGYGPQYDLGKGLQLYVDWLRRPR